LPREWAPRQLLLVDELPLVPGGKVDRAHLRRLAGATEVHPPKAPPDQADATASSTGV
jgi:hypothetical protein